MKKAKLIFDIGKTNKKLILFGEGYEVLYEEEEKYPEVADEDGFPCDDIEKIEKWVVSWVEKILADDNYEITGINFSTYGASLVYLDDAGRRCAPVYNYLKPISEEVKEKFSRKYNGEGDFFRKTASPDLGLLNSGIQIFRLKEERPEIFKQVKSILHLPQYISYLITGKINSEYTSIGCHTAMWDYDNFTYHSWLNEEGIKLPEPVSNSTVFDLFIKGKNIRCGIGIHDSSASLAPYLFEGNEFILLSTGTWCINMNPFNPEPLTAEELKRDCLCYLSTQKRQVKSSRLFMGHMHDEYLKKLNAHFNKEEKYFKSVKPDTAGLSSWLSSGNAKKIFSGDAAEWIGDLNQFDNFDEAYNRLVYDLTLLNSESVNLVIPKKDNTKCVYISGGFANNKIFTGLLAAIYREKEVYVSEINNSSALGAAMVIDTDGAKCGLGLETVSPLF